MTRPKPLSPLDPSRCLSCAKPSTMHFIDGSYCPEHWPHPFERTHTPLTFVKPKLHPARDPEKRGAILAALAKGRSSYRKGPLA